jgi:ABC-2 type transport system ATP-binding protein
MADELRPPVIECRAVAKRFGASTALASLDLRVDPGGVVGFLGPNGAGKSTTIRILLGLLRADAGAVRVLGEDPWRADPTIRRRIGYLPGELRLDERLGVDETLASWGRLRGGVDDRYRRSLCERLELDTGRQVRGLSTGNRRKVGLVGALMGRPELLVLDEPTAGVDPLVQAEFSSMVDEVRRDGCTVLLSSHVLSEVERVADHVVVIRAGRSVFAGSVEELRRTIRQPFTVRFGVDAPLAELRAAPGVDVTAVEGREVEGTIAGSPEPLLAVLVRHPVEHLLLPEADLEAAFLHLYEGDP